MNFKLKFFEMSGSEKLGLCCFRLKNTPQNKKIVDVVNKTMDTVFEEAMEMISKAAQEQGVQLLDELKPSLRAVARSHGLFAEHPPSPVPERKEKK